MKCVVLYAALYLDEETAARELRKILEWYRENFIKGGMVVWSTAKVRRAIVQYALAHGCWKQRREVNMRRVMRIVKRRIGTVWR